MTNQGTFTKKELEALAQLYASGKIGKYDIPLELARAIHEFMVKRVSVGYGEAIADPLNPLYSKTKLLNNNLARFVSYKLINISNDMSIARAVLSGDNLAAKSIGVTTRYLNDWALTEYATATKLAAGARRWDEITADTATFPLLQYLAVVDDNSRDDHAALNGVIRPANDGFWDTNFPPNGYNCRCDVAQLRSGEVTPMRKIATPTINPVFAHNPGKSSQIFNRKHPYFGNRQRVLNNRQKAVAEVVAKKLLI